MDLTNAYLHADIVDEVYIIIPQGFKGEGEIAKLDKATYGTKQGAPFLRPHIQLEYYTTLLVSLNAPTNPAYSATCTRMKQRSLYYT